MIVSIDMKWTWAILLSCAALATAGSAAPDSSPAALGSVGKVYLLSMSRGLDQYLANRITNVGLMEVVTDPALAEAVMTDSIGKGFEDRMAQLYPAAKPPEAPKKAGEKEEDSPAATAAAQPVKATVTGWGHGKGNIFLVDVKARQVLWSTYDLASDGSSRELDRSAARIVSKLQKDLSKKK
jgi:hypothetical protein